MNDNKSFQQNTFHIKFKIILFKQSINVTSVAGLAITVLISQIVIVRIIKYS